jgi:hypothetical protein
MGTKGLRRCAEVCVCVFYCRNYYKPVRRGLRNQALGGAQETERADSIR